MLIHSNYRADIDGLRAIAILAVIAFHAFPLKFCSGYTGVDIFFVISGYLISTIIFGSLEQNRFSFTEFYGKRVKRIFPALLIVMLSSYLFGWFILFSDEFAQLGKHIAGGSTFLSNLILWSEAGYFDNASESKPLLHLWSLAIEEQFYVFWPVCIWVTYKYRINFLFVTLVILLLSFAINLIAVFHKYDDFAFFSPFTRFWELMVGGVLAYLTIHKPALMSRKPNVNALAGLILIFLGIFILRGHNSYPGYRALLPVIGAFLLISAGPNALINHHIMGHRFLVGIGLISYPLYLWHWVVFSFLWILEGGELDTATAFTGIAISFTLALITYFYIEKPIKEIKLSPVMMKTLNSGLVGLMLVFAGIGFFTYQKNGFTSREANSYALKFDDSLSTLIDPSLQLVSCLKILNIAPIDNERCLSNSKEPEYLVLGDSHSESFYQGMKLKGSSLPAIQIAKSNMLPFVDYVSHFPRDSANQYGESIAVVNHALDIAKNYHSIKTIILITRGEHYFTNNNAISKIGTDKRLPLLDAKKAFVEGYTDLIGKFSQMGKQVIFVTEWPQLNYPPHRFLHRSLSLKSSTHDDIILRADVENNQEAYLKLVTEIKRQKPELLIFNTLPFFCNAEKCNAKDNNTIYYIDDNHLSLSGSHQLLLNFIAWLETQKKIH
jgi:peptidoglycan/LPS O-acetylase OafA/YrhL